MNNSDQNPFEGENFEQFIRDFLANPENAEQFKKYAEATGLPQDPAQLAAAMQQLRHLFQDQANASNVSWKLALSQARTIAGKDSKPVSEEQRRDLAAAFSVASLWLAGVTQIASTNQEPKLLTRELWVQEVFPLIETLASPVASRLGKALSETVAEAPGSADAGGLLQGLGGSLIAMQLGNAIGELASEVTSGGDIGLPIFAEQRAAFVPQNLQEFASGLSVEIDQVYLYLAVREFAHSALFKHARWLRDHVIQQIQNYAREIRIDVDKIADLAQNLEGSSGDAIREALQNGSFIANKTAEQAQALQSIENLLALVDGWVDAITEQSTALLPMGSAIAEAVRRRRAEGGPAEKTFGTLLGLELRPRKLREASALWKQLGIRYGSDRRDSLWAHPDLLPTALELANPDQLFARIDDQGDELDKDLRDLLGQ